MGDPVTILLNGVGGSTPLSIARALKHHGKEGNYRLIGTDCDPLATGHYQRDIIDRSYLIPPAAARGYWEALKVIVKKEGVDMALVQPEAEVEAWAERAVRHEAPCSTLLPPAALVHVLRDKAGMTDLLADTGLVPETTRVDRELFDAERIGKRLGYPYWIRANAGSSGLGAYKVEAPGVVESWLAINPTVEHFVASPFLPGRNLACKLLYFEGRLLRSACAERVHYIMSKTAPSGITGNTAFGRFINAPEAVEIAHKSVAHICDRIGVTPHGFLTVDLKEDVSGSAKVTEINVRHVAFTSSFAAAGANIAEDMVRLTLGHQEVAASYHNYTFDRPLVFLRDVDVHPVVIAETELLSRGADALQ